jgi:hypothetical protein
VGVPAGRADHRGEVLDLSLDGVVVAVAAVAAATAVVAVDRELLGQQAGQFDLAGVGDGGPVQ